MSSNVRLGGAMTLNLLSATRWGFNQQSAAFVQDILAEGVMVMSFILGTEYFYGVLNGRTSTVATGSTP